MNRVQRSIHLPALVVIALCVLRQEAVGSTCITIADGAFTNTSVWDCGCVPTACDTVIVSHQLTASMPVDMGALFLWIMPQGQLNSSSTLLWSAGSRYVLVEGELSASLLEVHTADSVVNHGMITVDTLLLYDGQFMNYGSLVVPSICGHTYWSDRFWNYGDMTCGWLGSYTPAAFVNTAYLGCDEAYFSFMYSSGSIVVNGSLLGTVDLVISEGSTLQVTDTFRIVQYMDNYGYIGCGHFMNGDTVGTAISHIYSGGLIQCNGFTNRESGYLYGPGTLCIAGHSENHGLVSGPIRVCDTTPTNTSAPFTDVHDGSVLLPVYGCNGTVCSTVGIAEAVVAPALLLYPQPATESFTIAWTRIHEAATIALVDATGRTIRSTLGPFSDHVVTRREGLNAGLYMVVISDFNGRSIASSRIVFTDN